MERATYDLLRPAAGEGVQEQAARLGSKRVRLLAGAAFAAVAFVVLVALAGRAPAPDSLVVRASDLPARSATLRSSKLGKALVKSGLIGGMEGSDATQLGLEPEKVPYAGSYPVDLASALFSGPGGSNDKGHGGSRTPPQATSAPPPTPAPSGGGGGGSGVGEMQPPPAWTFVTEGDMHSFAPKYKSILASLGYSADAAQPTGYLNQSCAVMTMPCVAEVAHCLQQKTSLHGGKVSVSAGACQCLSKGHAKSIQIPNKPKVKLACTLPCLEAIETLVIDYVAEHNGAAGEKLNCEATMEDLRAAEYGQVEHFDDDVDETSFYDVKDPKVKESAEALHVFVNSKLAKCHRPVYTGNLSIDFALGDLVSEGEHQFAMEVTLGNRTYAARVIHRTPEDIIDIGLESAQSADPQDYLGYYHVIGLQPDPCDNSSDARLAATYKDMELARSQALANKKSTWAPKYDFKKHFGKTIKKHFAKGLIPMTEQERARRTVLYNTEGFVPVPTFDARDHLATEAPCKAAKILDQGACGSCYAFAAATTMSYRLCEQREAGWNHIIAPQEILDCSVESCKALSTEHYEVTCGCTSGGYPLRALEDTIKHPSVPNWCDPYDPVEEACGNTCSTGLHVHAIPGTGKQVGGFDRSTAEANGKLKEAIAESVKQIQMEIQLNGPVVFSFKCYDDFIRFSGEGVYQHDTSDTSATSQHAGGHAVVAIGWGTEKINGEDVDFWLIQNSWGPDWGDKGTAKFRRGIDESSCESWGVVSIKVEAPALCEDVQCMYGEKQQDCTCKCEAGYSGTKCDVCEVTEDKCGPNGKKHPGPSMCECVCPSNAWGIHCENSIKLDRYASCVGKQADYTFTWDYDPHVFSISTGSYVGVFNEGEEKAWHIDNGDFKWNMVHDEWSYVCGRYEEGVNCPAKGSYVMPVPTKPGKYDAWVMMRVPGGFYQSLRHRSHKIGTIEILAEGCTDDALAKADGNLNPSHQLQLLVNEVAAEDMAKQVEMTERLTDLTEADKLAKEQESKAPPAPPKIFIEGISTTDHVWIGSEPYHICYSMDLATNVNPKHLSMSTAGGHVMADALNLYDEHTPLPTESSACVEFSIGYYYSNVDDYVVNLVDSNAKTLASTGSFSVSMAWMWIDDWPTVTAESGKHIIRFPIVWGMWSEKYCHVDDVIEVVNSADEIVYWFYTSDLGHSPGDKPGAEGRAPISFPIEANHPLGGYRARYLSEGTQTIATMDTRWVNWAYVGNDFFRGGL